MNLPSVIIGVLACATVGARADVFYMVDNTNRGFFRGDTSALPNMQLVTTLPAGGSYLDLSPSHLPSHLFITGSLGLMLIRESDGNVVTQTPLLRATTNLGFDPLTNTLYGLPTSGTSELYTIDWTSGAVNIIGPTGLPGVAPTTVAMVFDPQTGQLFASNDSNLYRINPATGAATLVGFHGFSQGFGLAYNPFNEQLYLCETIGDRLYTINRQTAATTLVGGPLSGVTFATGMSFTNIPAPGALGLFMLAAGAGFRQRRAVLGNKEVQRMN